jgi:5'-nucleotidase / UDP-sugar diphosphatase
MRQPWFVTPRTALRWSLLAATLGTSLLGAPLARAETAPEVAAFVVGGERCGREDCPLGILVAEAMRAHLLATEAEAAAGPAAPTEPRGTAGGIVAALVPASALGEGLEAGVLTAEALAAALPGAERLVEVEVTGAALLAALEAGAASDGEPRLLQVAGMRYALDPAAPPGQRVEARVWRDAGSEFIRHGNEWNVMRRSARWMRLDPEARYRVATTAALVGGPDGFAVPDGAAEGPPLTEVVAAYLRAQAPYAPVSDGRIAPP